MPAQTTYERLTPIGIAGDIAYMAEREVISRAVEDATLAAPVAVGTGTDPDTQVLVGSTGGPAFGITLRKLTTQGVINTGALTYVAEEVINVMRRGYIWAICPAGCVPGDVVNYLDATGVLDAGAVALAGVAAADGGNTGDGTASAVTVGTATKEGVYTLTCTDATVSGSEIFGVVDPDGIALANLTVGVAYLTNQFGITISDGAADFIVGDIWTITMAPATAQTVLPGAEWTTTAAAGGLAIIRLDGTAPEA